MTTIESAWNRYVQACVARGDTHHFVETVHKTPFYCGAAAAVDALAPALRDAILAGLNPPREVKP